MKPMSLVAILALAVGFEACLLAKSKTRVPAKTEVANSFASETTKPDFDSDIKPIFQARCQPCHFQGGQVYEKLPFDKPATITKLGTRLFTRIKDEKERRVIQEFLDTANSETKNR